MQFLTFPWVLPPVAPEEWKRYLIGRCETVGLPAADQLLQMAGAHPMDTMLLANEALRVVRELHQPEIMADDVSLAFERVMQGLPRSFDDTWNGLPHTEQLVLRRLASGEGGPYAAPGPNHAQVKRAVDRLVELGILVHQKRGRYLFVEPPLLEHIRQMMGGDE